MVSFLFDETKEYAVAHEAKGGVLGAEPQKEQCTNSKFCGNDKSEEPCKTGSFEV